MKKRIIKIALMSVSMLALASCKQEELVQAASQKVDNNRVVFVSIAAYESLFADPNTTDEKASEVAARYGTFAENTRISGFDQAEDTLYPEFLQKILNDDHIVQIQDWIIKVDMAAEQVLVLDKKNEAEYVDLVTNNLQNKNILVYSTEEDVLSLLQEGQTSNARVTAICGDRNADSKGNDGDAYIDSYHRLNWHMKYVPAGGITFQLTATVTNETYDASRIVKWQTAPSAFYKITWTARIKPKCRDQYDTGRTEWTASPINTINAKPYTSSRALTKYSFYCQFIYNETGLNEFSSGPNGIVHGY